MTDTEKRQGGIVELAEVQSELRAKGYAWHSFDRQGVGSDGITRYWFNGSMYGEGRGRLEKQPYGWFTLDEMRAEKFAEGCGPGGSS